MSIWATWIPWLIARNERQDKVMTVSEITEKWFPKNPWQYRGHPRPWHCRLQHSVRYCCKRQRRFRDLCMLRPLCACECWGMTDRLGMQLHRRIRVKSKDKKKGLRTIHPSKAFTRNHLKVNTLIPIFGIYQMWQFHSVELKWTWATARSVHVIKDTDLLRNHSIKIDKGCRHPTENADR